MFREFNQIFIQMPDDLNSPVISKFLTDFHKDQDLKSRNEDKNITAYNYLHAHKGRYDRGYEYTHFDKNPFDYETLTDSFYLKNVLESSLKKIVLESCNFTVLYEYMP